jgi:putative ABC transport system ATP-binding protein
MTAPQAIVRIEQLSKIYQEAERARKVLDQVSLTIHEGEFLVLLGKSGSGKSTLLNLISGIDQPDGGHIWLGAPQSNAPVVEINALSERQRTLYRRDHVGIIFQFFNLIPTLTVLENVTLPHELRGQSRRDSETLARALLQEVGLANRADTYPDKLSGGEQQRVAIARALVHQPLLVLADEPTGNLDEETGQRVLDLLLRLTRGAGKTLVMATHNPDIVPLADRVFSIHEGQLVAVESHAATPLG